MLSMPQLNPEATAWSWSGRPGRVGIEEPQRLKFLPSAPTRAADARAMSRSARVEPGSVLLDYGDRRHLELNRRLLELGALDPPTR